MDASGFSDKFVMRPVYVLEHKKRLSTVGVI